MRWIYRHGGKRFFDLSLSLVGLLVFALPILWIAWRIWKETGRPIFFRQNRVGYGGRNFSVWKFRTMTPGDHITRFGRSLRGTAMDELPQLLNILKGDMSFVGPRPLVPEELEALRQIPEGRRRFSLRPGLSGLAQLYSGKAPPLPQRLGWDLGYIEQCSLWLDLKILLTSVWVTLQGAWEKPDRKTSWKICAHS